MYFSSGGTVSLDVGERFDDDSNRETYNSSMNSVNK